ncbi:MAG: CHAT domain-containing protein [Polyangiaceae bacterium]
MSEEHVLHFQIQPSGAAYSVALAIDGRNVGEAPFDDAWRRAGETGAALQRIEDGVATVDDLQTVGIQLWTGLIADDVKTGPIRAEVGALRKRQIKEDVRLTIRIEAPPEIDLLPWEALYDPRRTSFLARDPQCSVLRHPSTADVDVPDSECRKTDKLRILVVIPAGSGLNVAAEWERLRFSLEPHKDLIESGGPTVLQGRVTYDDLCAALAKDRYDIVHFIGHGWVDDQNKVWIRMNSASGGEENKIAEVFATAFQRRGVQFVFLNCCHGAVPGTTKAFAGLGPALLTFGVPAVLAMRYAIPDGAAVRLSGVFYSALLAGPNRGRVDVAAQVARDSFMGLLDQETCGARLLATPVMFVAPGTTKVFELPETASPLQAGGATIQPAAGLSDETRAFIAKLTQSVFKGRAVLVLGPHLVESTRDATALGPLSIRWLVDHLATTCKYDVREIEDAERAGDWLLPLLLQRICQHFEASEGTRGPLTEALIRAYTGVRTPPSELVRIAQWPFAGAVCAHFDGLFERALRAADKRFRSAYGPRDPVAGDPDEPIVLHLRGSVELTSSLVLTEAEHDDLWDSLAKMPRESASIVTGHVSRSLVFMGVSPRDASVRRLARCLLPAENRKDAGRTFLVWPGATEADKGVWQPFNPVWIDAPPAVVVSEVTRLLATMAPAGKGRSA